jgi:hypothetical protein
MVEISADEIFENIVNEYLRKFLEKNPDFTTNLGLHEPYGYMLPKGSTGRFVENFNLWRSCLKVQVSG